MIRIVIVLLSLPLWGQSVVHRYPAGTDAEGNQLTVVRKHYPKQEPDEKRCVPGEQYVLEKSRGARVVSSEAVVTLCQTDDQAEITVHVAPNLISVHRDGGTQAGYYIHRTYQLSPWRAVAVEDCSFYGSGESTAELWNYGKLRGQAWHGSSKESGGICVRDAKLFSYLIVPSVPFDARRMETSRGRLGSCALTMNASGRNGFVVWGKADSQDPVEVKLLQAGPHTLLAQVIDPRRHTQPATSWVNADHFEVWMGTRGELGGPESTWQFGIPVDEGPVQVGFGKPGKLPTVRRWSANLPDGRTAIVLNIELPPQPNGYSDGLTVVYSQSRDGRGQKRMIATSPVKRSDLSTLGSHGSVLMDNSAGDYLTCDLVQGSLEITGSASKPVEVPRPQTGSSH